MGPSSVGWRAAWFVGTDCGVIALIVFVGCFVSCSLLLPCGKKKQKNKKAEKRKKKKHKRKTNKKQVSPSEKPMLNRRDTDKKGKKQRKRRKKRRQRGRVGMGSVEERDRVS
jgi:Flp pilus assembly protein TadB